MRNSDTSSDSWILLLGVMKVCPAEGSMVGRTRRGKLFAMRFFELWNYAGIVLGGRYEVWIKRGVWMG